MNKKDISIYLIEKRPKTLQINDLATLLCGDKKVLYTAIQNAEDEKRIEELCNKFKFKILILKENSKNIFNQPYIDILIGTDIKRMEIAKRLFLSKRLKEWGVYLDYPECCVNAYSQWDYTESLIYHIFSKTNKKKKFPFYINNITNFYSRTPKPRKKVKTFFKDFIEKNMPFLSTGIDFEPIIPWHPCSYNCKESIKRGKEIYEFMEKHIPKISKIRRKILANTFIFYDDFEFLVLKSKNKYTSDNSLIEIKNILPYPKTFVKKNVISAIEKSQVIEFLNGNIIKPKELKNFLFIPFE